MVGAAEDQQWLSAATPRAGMDSQYDYEARDDGWLGLATLTQMSAGDVRLTTALSAVHLYILFPADTH
jgi:hypothetical protein